MIRIVELTLTPSTIIHPRLLLLILSDPFNGAIIKMGIVDKMVIDYVNTPYDQIQTGEYPIWKHTYSSDFVIHDDYLVFMCRDQYIHSDKEIDNYKVRINWIHDDLSIGAYQNSIVHSKGITRLTSPATRGIPNLYGYFKTQRVSSEFYLQDINNNIHTYIVPEAYHYNSYFNAVITDTGTQLALFSFNDMDMGGSILLDSTKLNSYDLKDGQQLIFQGKQIYQGELPYESTGYLDVIDPANEWAIKQATSGFIATVKSVESNRGLVIPIDQRSCYVLWNGNSPSAWDREIYFIEETIKTKLTKPDLASLYPQLGIISYQIAHSSYEVYFDTTKGFWRDFKYCEELLDE